MKRTFFDKCVLSIMLSVALSSILSGCGKAHGESRSDGDTGPRPAKVEADVNAENFKVDHAEQFALAVAREYMSTPELNVTGVVDKDVSRQVPVPSLTSGRVTEIDARVGDEVKKGQLLFKVRSTDIAGALSDYRKAVKNEQSAVENVQLSEKNERFAKVQLERSQLLYEKGATAKSDLEIKLNAEDAAQTAVVNSGIALENARVDVHTTKERLDLFEADANASTGIVDVRAPVTGIITDQQITNGAGVQALTPPNPFTISDLSHIWILCDVYENDIAKVQVGEYAKIRANAYPDRVFAARISNINAILDPNLHTTKVRLEMDNPGIFRLGMFVTATFQGMREEKRASVPATAILHLHDRQWVYVPTVDGSFRRVEVVVGNTLPENMQEIISGIQPGEKVVANALVLQNTVEK